MKRLIAVLVAAAALSWWIFAGGGNPLASGGGGDDPTLLLEVRARTAFDGAGANVAMAPGGVFGEVPPGGEHPIVVDWARLAGETEVDGGKMGFSDLPGTVGALEDSPNFSGVALEVVRRLEGDALVVRVGDELVEVDPGEEAAIGLIAAEDGPRSISDEQRWRSELSQALDGAEPVAVVRLMNRGLVGGGDTR